MNDFKLLRSLVSRLSPPERLKLLNDIAETSTDTKLNLYKYIMGDQPLVLLDLDGTLADFVWPGLDLYDPYEIGLPLPGALTFCWELIKVAKVAVTTTRLNFWPLTDHETSARRLQETILKWLKIHSFPSEMAVLLDALPPHVVYIGDSTLRPEFGPLGLSRVCSMIQSWNKAVAQDPKLKSQSNLTYGELK